MCKQCELNPVYEFTNQRKLCKNCFIRYFQKKVLYIIRKFGMIQKGEVVGYEVSGTQGCTPRRCKNLFKAPNQVGLKENIQKNIFTRGNFKGVVLEDVLKMIGEKGFIEIKKLPRTNDTMVQTARKLKMNKIALSTTIDSTSQEIVNEMINGNVRDLMASASPVEKLGKKSKIIKPLYLFLDKEVLLYAKLKKLKFKKIKETKNKIEKFIDELEKKHPEVKRAVVNSYLGLSS